jgi:hypothetical protein
MISRFSRTSSVRCGCDVVRLKQGKGGDLCTDYSSRCAVPTGAPRFRQLHNIDEEEEAVVATITFIDTCYLKVQYELLLSGMVIREYRKCHTTIYEDTWAGGDNRNVSSTTRESYHLKIQDAYQNCYLKAPWKKHCLTYRVCDTPRYHRHAHTYYCNMGIPRLCRYHGCIEEKSSVGFQC